MKAKIKIAIPNCILNFVLNSPSAVLLVIGMISTAAITAIMADISKVVVIVIHPFSY